MRRLLDILKSLYRAWMKVTHVLGKVMTAVLLSVFYVVVIGIAKLVTLLARKDLLGEPWKNQESHWKLRNNFSIRREDLLKPY